jgi:hypothetical protein
MRVFCPEHKRSFFAPRQSPIRCENRGHVLGELDFAGNGALDGSFSGQPRWQYCCNCEHFSLIAFDDNGLHRCQVCTRRSSNLYLCGSCLTLSFESVTPLETKNFTLTADGAPRPCCPGCLRPASADLREHTCDDVRTSFVTSLTTCPICDERLDIGPAFPSPVRDYLKRTKAANKLYVTFDYETELFVLIEDGEFVVVSNNDDTGRTFLLPRSTRLSAARDFYELYQDYYHCSAPASGEITISDPAVVIEARDGWKFATPGVLVVAADEIRKAPVVSEQRSEPAVQPAVQQKAPTPAVETGTATPCKFCETLVEAKYAFCWKCGHPRAKSEQGGRPERSRLIVSAEEFEDEPEMPSEKRRAFGDSTSWGSTQTGSTRPTRSVLKLSAIVGAGLLFGALSLFALTRSSSSAPSADVAEAAAPVTRPSATPAVNREITGAEVETASLNAPAPTPEDAALERLRQIAGSSDQTKVLQKFSETEKKFSSDYRFPYERAKVTIAGRKKNFREEAFAALTRAAQKAIHSGKAGEMLEHLNEDSDGDFQKLSRGHREWVQLQKALKSKDVTVLNSEDGL